MAAAALAISASIEAAPLARSRATVLRHAAAAAAVGALSTTGPGARMTRLRVMIENLSPQVDGGRFAAKRVIGEPVTVEADVFTDGHDKVSAALRFRKSGDTDWHYRFMQPLGNDRWRGEFTPEALGPLRIQRRRVDRPHRHLATRSVAQTRSAARMSQSICCAARRWSKNSLRACPRPSARMARGTGPRAGGHHREPRRSVPKSPAAKSCALLAATLSAPGSGQQPTNRLCRSTWTACARVSRAGTSSSRVPPVAQAWQARHVRRLRGAPALRRADGFRRAVPAADPSDRRRQAQGP